MAATTTENNTALPSPYYLRPYSTQCGYSTGVHAFICFTTDGSSGANHRVGGFCAISTGMEQVRFPINSPGAKSMILALYEGIGPSSTYFGWVGIKRNKDTFTGMGGMTSNLPASVGADVAPAAGHAGWTFYETTAALIHAATENSLYILGPLDLTKHYLSLEGTSGAAIDKYQNYIQITAGYSSIAMNGSTIAYTEYSTNHPTAADADIYVAHFEVP